MGSETRSQTTDQGMGNHYLKVIEEKYASKDTPFVQIQGPKMLYVNFLLIKYDDVL